MGYTANQNKVINHFGNNLLVSAGAGSGKTSVLTEHVIKLITDDKNPIDIDKLLIVTFTNASASDMLEKINDAISKLINNPESSDNKKEHLRKQQGLVVNAHICTIDSFFAWIVKNNFEKSTLDPDYRLAGDGELKLIRTDVFDELIKRKFKEGDSNFYRFIEVYSSDKDNTYQDILKIFEALYNKAESLADPIAFIERLIDGISKEFSKIEDIPLYNWYMTDVKNEFVDLTRELSNWDNFFDDKYNNIVNSDISILSNIANASTYNEFVGSLSVKFERLPSIKAELKTDAHIKYKDLRDDAKSLIKKYNEYFRVDNELEIIYSSNESNKDLSYLLDLFITFYNEYKNEKRERNIADFGDISHEAISIIRNNPSVREMYQEQFYEIMIDEFQDSNDLQDELFTLISKGNNLFMVGDIKQSIYAFRNATPSIFMRHKDEYNQGKTNGYVIDLLENFRCRKEVVDSVNEVFESIMTAKLSGVNYSKDAKLIYGANVYTNPVNDNNYTSEIAHITTDNARSSNNIEARYIINKIKELTDPETGLDVYDKHTDSFRKATYKDVVILSRSTSPSVSYIREFKKHNIPIVSTKSEGYYSASEIKLMLSVLSIIDNPKQDIPLVAVMLSPIGGFTKDELARIKNKEKYEPDFYDMLVRSKDEKVICFLNWLNYLRKISISKNIVELINIVLNDSLYLHYLQSLSVGDNRVANIEKLKSIAKEYEESSYGGIFDFIRFVESMQKYDMDLEEAQVLSDSNDVVRFMTIHKSKGLEFPIVFLVRANGKFNSASNNGEKFSSYFDLYNNINYISAPYVDTANAAEYKTISSVFINKKNEIDTINEELRLLYVAMTRAREKLIIVASGGDDFEFSPCGDNLLRIKKSNSYISLIKLANSCQSWKVYNCSVDDINEQLTSRIKDKMINMADFESIANSTTLDYEMDYDLTSSTIKSIYSISEIKKLSDVDDVLSERVFEAPFRRCAKTNSDAALIGSAYHLLFEKINPNNGTSIQNVTEMIKDLSDSGLIDPSTAASLDSSKICSFYKSNIGKEVINAYNKGGLYREKSFIMGISPSEINPNALDDADVIVQGVIDMYYIDDEGITLVDYKSNKINEGEEEQLIDIYKTQVKYYAMSLEKAYNKPIKRALLYSIALEKFIEVKING